MNTEAIAEAVLEAIEDCALDAALGMMREVGEQGPDALSALLRQLTKATAHRIPEGGMVCGSSTMVWGNPLRTDHGWRCGCCRTIGRNYTDPETALMDAESHARGHTPAPKVTRLADPYRPGLRVQRSRVRGSSLPSGTVVVTRGTAFGNPFTIADARARFKDGDGEPLPETEARDMVVDAFTDWAREGTQAWPIENGDALREKLLARLPELAGKDLACWCGPDQRCHADVLLELVAEHREGSPDDVLRALAPTHLQGDFLEELIAERLQGDE